MLIHLERCSIQDKDFVLRVAEEAMREYVQEAFGMWDAAIQRRRLDEVFSPATHSLIVVDGVRAGLLVVEDRTSELFLAQIFLLKAFQRKGIGSTLIGGLIERARAEKKPLRLRVLRVNPARALYERLGFVVASSTPHHYYLEC